MLGTLVAESWDRAAALADRHGELVRLAHDRPAPPPFAAALRRADVALITEVKRRSPSKGAINPALDLLAFVRGYSAGGASALSILTQTSHFGGRVEDLAAVADAVPVPVLRKDFLVAPVQLAEARALGASAALLIARAVPPALLGELAACALELGLETLVEVRDEAELALAAELGAPVIGVNTRDLETLVIDAATGDRLVPQIPAGSVGVWESGVASPADVERAARAGADAVLVGSSLSAAPDPRVAVASLTGVPVRGRPVAAA